MSLKIAEAFVEIGVRTDKLDSGTLAAKALAAKRGQEIATALMTPMERMRSQIGKLFDIQKAGGNMSPETMNRGIKGIVQEYRDATGATALFAERQARAAQAFDSSRTALERYLSRLSELKNQKVKGDITPDTYSRQVAAAKSVYQADTGITAARAAEQSRLNQLLMTGVTPLQLYNKDLALLNRLLKNGELNQKDFAVAARAAKSAMMTGGGAGRGGMVAMQASYGIQDAIAGGATGGLRGALLGSANNMAQMATLAFGPWTAAIIGVSVGLGSLLIPKLADALSGTRSLKDEVVDFTSAVEDMSAAFKAIDLQTELEFSRESLSKATSEALKDKELAEQEKHTAATRKIEAAEREASNTEDDVQKFLRQQVEEADKAAKVSKGKRSIGFGDSFVPGDAADLSAAMGDTTPLTPAEIDAKARAMRESPRVREFVGMDAATFKDKSGELSTAEANFITSLRHLAEVEKQIAEEREKALAANQRMSAIGEFKPAALNKEIDKTLEQNEKDNRRYQDRKQKEQEQRDKSMSSLSRALSVENAGSKLAQAFAGIEDKVKERLDSIDVAFPKGGPEADRLKAETVKSGKREAEEFLKPQKKAVGQMVGIEGFAKQVQLAAVNNDQTLIKDQLKELKLLNRNIDILNETSRKKTIAYLS